MNKSRLFGCLLIMVVVAAVCIMTGTASAALVAHYALDETGAATVAVDSGTIGNGTYVNNPTLGAASANAGLYGTAVDFDGVDDYVLLTGDVGDVGGSGIYPERYIDNITVAAWIRPDVIGGARPILTLAEWDNDPDKSGWTFAMTGNRLQLGMMDIAGYETYYWTPVFIEPDLPNGITGNVGNGTWMHVAASYSWADREVNYYVNGLFFETNHIVDTVDPIKIHVQAKATSQNYNIGAWSTFYYFNGGIDDVRVYDTLLTEAEVAALAVGAPAPPGPGDANRNGVVDDLDAALLAENWQKQSGASWNQGDFNDDGKVDDLDAAILAANWTPPPVNAVPEPTGLILLLGAVLSVCLLRRFRKTLAKV